MTSKQFTEQVLSMPEEQREQFLEILKTQLSEEDYKVVAMHFAFESMFRNPAKYEAMKNAVCDKLCEEFYGHTVEKANNVKEDAVLIGMYSNSIL
jgi:Asp-tRNA(Asn)/Glu-tRNA(Gln) amidotransferase B subunit